MPTATTKYERNAIISLATLTHDDGSTAYVWCPIPGGRPVFQFDLASPDYTTVDGAPEILTHGDFVQFVSERFGD